MKSIAARRIFARLRSCYTADYRALALMRIGVALLVLVDLVIRIDDFNAFYDDNGIWPSHLARSLGWKSGYWSLHLLSDSGTFRAILFGVHFIAAGFVLLGYRTRLFTVILWLLTVSLHNRNLFILQAGDDLLRLAIFWGIFLPWHAQYSMDAKRRKIPRASFAMAGYFFLIASVYAFTFFLKSGDDWLHGDAVYYALSLGQLRVETGDFVYGVPWLMKILTWTVLGMELLIPLLILAPVKNGSTRWAAFLLIIILHAGISLHLYVGLFVPISIVTALGLIPARKFRKWGIRDLNATVKLNYPGRWLMLRNTFFAGVIVVCFIVNLETLPGYPLRMGPCPVKMVNALRLDQYWGMFSPQVMRTDGWLVYEGITANGESWDLRNNAPEVDFSEPARIVTHYKNDRWRKLAENLQGDQYTFLRPLFARYMLRQWNDAHPDNRMASLNVYFMEVLREPEYRSTAPRKKLLYTAHVAGY